MTHSPCISSPTTPTLKIGSNPFSRILKIWQSLVHDKFVAQVLPSSPWLVARVLDQIEFNHARSIVEFGAGDGALTQGLLKRMNQEAVLTAFESNQELVEELSSRIEDPRLNLIRTCVLKQERFFVFNSGTADAVISGIPLSLYDDIFVGELLRLTSQLLVPSGKLILYQVATSSHATRTRLISLLSRHYEVLEEEVVWLNIPPLRVITCESKRFNLPQTSSPISLCRK